jgi:NADH-quinone oxidoreductase subunit J
MLTEKIFYFLSFLAIVSASMVVLSKNPIHSVLFLIITFFTLTGHYVLLNAHFIALVNIVVYAGAIMVLFLFVIMFLNLNTSEEPVKSGVMRLVGIVAGGILFVLLIAGVKSVSVEVPDAAISDIGTIKKIGMVLFNDFLFPFELASVLLLAAMVGSVMLGKKEEAGISEK